MIAAIDPGVGTLVEIDALAELVRDALADQPVGAPTWVVSHWVDHGPGTGGAHLALSLQWDRVCGGAAAWECLLQAAEVVVGQPYVYGQAAEIGLAQPGRSAGLAGLAASARTRVQVHAGRSSGRAIVFPGSAAAAGAPTVGELLERTAIDVVTGLGALAVEDDAVVHTFGHVRPVFRPGGLVLPVVPYGAVDVTPFEVRHPTPCCAGH